jgi:uncharacterized protein (DUF58 family)
MMQAGRPGGEMKRFQIHFKSLALYGFSLLLAFLAGMSFGGLPYFLFWLLLLYPLLSFVYIIYGFFCFRFYEEFSHEHPAKGDTVKYKLSITNESPFLAITVGVHFQMVYPGMTEGIKDLVLTLKHGSSFSREYAIRCPYRGIYTVGLKMFRLQDPLGWLKIHPEVWYRTFYVYPRIIQLDGFPSGIERSVRNAGFHSGFADDATLFMTLDDYRSGQPVRHMAWKKFISSGTPFLKTFEKSALPGLDVVVDLRRLKEPDQALLEKEDCTIEILVAVAKYLSDNRVPSSIIGMGDRRYQFPLGSEDLFQAFYKATISIQFSGGNSPVALLRPGADFAARGSILYITHNLDPESFELMSSPEASGAALFSFFNQTAMDGDERRESARRLNLVREKGGRLITVPDGESIREAVKAS